MNSNADGPGNWSDVLFADGDEKTVSYRTAMVVYEESLLKGRFVGRGWNGSGYVSFYDGRVDPTDVPTAQAFWLEIDGQLLASDWEWAGFERTAEPSGGLHTVIGLKHAVRPVTVEVHSKLDGTPVIARWLEITNTGTEPAALAACGIWSGVVRHTKRWCEHVAGTGRPLYSLGYFDNPHWGHEGDFQWHDLPSAGYRVDGRYRRDRHRHPWFVIRNNATGEHFIGQLAWSGGYCFEFDLDADSSQPDASLFFRGGPDAPAPQRIIAPGETVQTPEMHLGLVFGDLDTAIQAMHEHLRKSVFMPQPRGRGGWVESGIGPEIEITVDEVFHAIDCAAELGAEVFFIDASWYAPPHGSWWSTVGDWGVDRQRFPDGIEPFRERVHEKGLLWGLWMDAERIGPDSQTAREHPEWLATAYDGEPRLGCMHERMKHWLGLYKGFVRPLMGTGRIYHHSPVVPSPEPQGWGVLELASADRTRAICGLFQLSGVCDPEYLLRFRGLDPSRRYRVTFDNDGSSCEVDGLTLTKQVLTIRLEGALTSELLICTEVGP